MAALRPIPAAAIGLVAGALSRCALFLASEYEPECFKALRMR